MRKHTCTRAWDMKNIGGGDYASNRWLQASYVACVALVHLASNPLWKITKAAGKNEIQRHEGACTTWRCDLPVLRTEARVNEENTDKKSWLDKHWINGSDFAQQAAAAPAIVSFMANAAADGLVGSSKCLE